MRVRWIVTDLDGTLVDRALRIVPRNLAALRSFREAGGEVIVATGRSESSALPYHRELGLGTPAILYNGARTVDLVSGAVLRERYLPVAAWKELSALRGVNLVAFARGEAHAVLANAELSDYARRDRITLRDPGGWDTLPADEITKCMLIGGDLQVDLPGVTTVRSEATYLEVLPEGATKGAALRALGLPLEQVAAIGDNPNDLSMIEAAGLGVAVGDGHPAVRAAADLVVGPCAGGAVADLVERLLQG
ncbi:MAG: HAD family phosphatase [Nonomuraea sp.]|nr:HAD family phosphatase [Nonomuraea sp.]